MLAQLGVLLPTRCDRGTAGGSEHGLKANFDDPTSRTLGSEFVGTSIASGGNGSDTTAGTVTQLAENPHIKFHNAQRGYVKCSVTDRVWRSDYKVMPQVTTPNAAVSTRASFVVEHDRPGLQAGQ